MILKNLFFGGLACMAVVFLVQCEGNETLEKVATRSTNAPRECFDYVYPIQVVMEGDTVEVVSEEHYAQLHLRCENIFTEHVNGTDPKGRDSNNRIPTGKGHTSATNDPYGDCPRDNDPWCGEMLFPLSITGVPQVEGELVIENDSTLQYYRWIVCD